MDPLNSSTSDPASLAADARPSAVEIAQVEEVFRSLSTALRNQRLYGADSPMLQRFVTAVGDRFREVWTTQQQLRCDVEERAFRWEGVVVHPLGAEAGDLPFQFYKDGIRELLFIPGFEDEIGPFLEVLARAPQLRDEEDDLITLLWGLDLSGVRYRYVEVQVEGVEEYSPSTAAPPTRVDPGTVKAAASAPAAPKERGLADDFQETLYFLDESDLRRLAAEVRLEAERDLWVAVTTALLDRLEDGSPERQQRIVEAMGELLSSALGAGRLDRAATILGELAALAAKDGALSVDALRGVRKLFSQLSSPETLGQLIQTLEEAPAALQGEGLAQLLGYFPPEALAPLLRVTETVTRPDVRRTLEAAVARLATDNRPEVTRLLEDSDPAVVAAGARWVGRLEIGSAADSVARLLGHADRGVRLAAIESITDLRAATAAKALLALLEDGDRDVRIAAAKAIGALEFSGARAALEAALSSKRLKTADRTEKIAFFETFGRLAGAEGVALLDRTLNGKGWLGQRETPEMRACAALGLARVRHPSARIALAAAANDEDPVVRSAVARAMREEAP